MIEAKVWVESHRTIIISPSPRVPRCTAVELNQLRRTWSAEFIPLPADLHVPRGGGLKSALLSSTAVGSGRGELAVNTAQKPPQPPQGTPSPWPSPRCAGSLFRVAQIVNLLYRR